MTSVSRCFSKSIDLQYWASSKPYGFSPGNRREARVVPTTENYRLNCSTPAVLRDGCDILMPVRFSRNSHLWRFIKGDIGLPSSFDALYYSGILRLVRPLTGGMGVILMAHRVGERSDFLAPMFTPPAFLERCIQYVRNAGWTIVSLEEMYRRVQGEVDSREPFVCFTFDDGYRDNITLALPIFERHNAPFTIYVPSGAPDRTINPWWSALDRIVSEHEEIVLERAQQESVLSCRTKQEKQKVYWMLWELCFPDLSVAEHAEVIQRLYSRYGITAEDELDRICLSWSELRRIAKHPLVTIGGHTSSHPVLPKLSDESARQEIRGGTERLEQELNSKVDHFAYPYGLACERDMQLVADLGFKTAVVTHKGNIFPETRNHLVTLPRRSFENLPLNNRVIRNSIFGTDNLLDMLRGRPLIIKAESVPAA